MAFNWKNLFRIQRSGTQSIDEAVTYSTILNSFNSAQSTEAKSLTAFSRGVQAISEAVAQVQFELYERKNGYDYRTNDNLNYLLNVAPNNFQNAFDFWRAATEMTLYQGNCFIEIKRDTNGNPKALYIIRRTSRPQALLADMGDAGMQLFWQFSSEEDVIPDRDVIHFKLNGTDETLPGNDTLV